MNGYVSAGVGVVCLVAALLIATVGAMQWPRAVVALVLTGVAGLLNTPIGDKAHSIATQVDGWAGQMIGRFTGTAVTGLIGLALFGMLAFWIYQNRIDMRTLGVAAAVPLTVNMIPGTLGVIAVTIVALPPTIVSWIVSATLGIG